MALEPKHSLRTRSLAQQFGFASFGVIVATMLVVGWWISREIQAGVTQTTALRAALYTTSFISPEIQELATGETLSEERVAKLRSLLSDTPLGKRIVSFKIWARRGRVVFATDASLIGKTFPVHGKLARAWKGEVASELSDLDEEENVGEAQLGLPLLETYAPVRETGGDRIIAAAEFYEVATDLEEELFHAQLSAWIVVGAAGLVTFAVLFGIVSRGSRTIADQEQELRARIRDLSALLAQNRELHERVRQAANQASELNEWFLRRVSAELHDGPAQGIGFALLRLDALRESLSPGSGESRSAELERIRGSLQDALREIRDLCQGLALPELEGLSLTETVRRAVRAHERRTGSRVEVGLEPVPEQAPLSVKIVVYRFLQEALNNAYNHAGGQTQRVALGHRGGMLDIRVSDEGPGFDCRIVFHTDGRLGLAGMRRRIEGCGGVFDLESSPGNGTRVSARIPVSADEPAHV